MDPAPLGLVLEGWALPVLLPPLEELLPPLPPVGLGEGLLPPPPLLLALDGLPPPPAEADGLPLPLPVAAGDGLTVWLALASDLQRGSFILSTKYVTSLGRFFAQPKHIAQESNIGCTLQTQLNKFCTSAELPVFIIAVG